MGKERSGKREKTVALRNPYIVHALVGIFTVVLMAASVIATIIYGIFSESTIRTMDVCIIAVWITAVALLFVMEYLEKKYRI